MNPLVQRPGETAAEGTPPAAATAPCLTCAECGATAPQRAANQLHCSAACRDRWNARIAARGKVAVPLLLVARLTRDGTRGDDADQRLGRTAASQLRHLLRRWKDEDAAAGRLDWRTFLRRRYAAGYDPL